MTSSICLLSSPAWPLPGPRPQSMAFCQPWWGHGWGWAGAGDWWEIAGQEGLGGWGTGGYHGNRAGEMFPHPRMHPLLCSACTVGPWGHAQGSRAGPVQGWSADGSHDAPGSSRQSWRGLSAAGRVGGLSGAAATGTACQGSQTQDRWLGSSTAACVTIVSQEHFQVHRSLPICGEELLEVFCSHPC